MYLILYNGNKDTKVASSYGDATRSELVLPTPTHRYHN